VYKGHIRWASYAFISVCSCNTPMINYCKLKLACHHCHLIKIIQLVGILLIRDSMTLLSFISTPWVASYSKNDLNLWIFFVTFFHGFIFNVFNLSFENIFNNTSLDSIFVLIPTMFRLTLIYFAHGKQHCYLNSYYWLWLEVCHSQPNHSCF